ncbi:MAG TPA: GNAT family N-acetyltransferase, partial [Acidimicrobiia bacterium]|nr:GNAT family N-acetyltransferase [Acidimicrobiia bacterium]
MSDPTPSRDIRDMTEESAYVVLIDGKPAGRAEYVTRDGRRVFTHTEVDDAHKGEGLAASLVRYALDDMRAQEILIVPLCPFFRSYIARHPEYRDLVDREMTKRYLSR